MMFQAEYVYEKFVSGRLRNPSLSKLCERAETRHIPGRNIWVFEDGSRIVAHGRGAYRRVTWEIPIEKEKDDPEPEPKERFYLVRVTTINIVGSFFTSIRGEPLTDPGIAMAQAKAFRNAPNVHEAEVLALEVTSIAKAWAVKPEDAKRSPSTRGPKPNKRALRDIPGLEVDL